MTEEKASAPFEGGNMGKPQEQASKPTDKYGMLVSQRKPLSILLQYYLLRKKTEYSWQRGTQSQYTWSVAKEWA